MILAEDKVTHLYIQAHLYNSCNANFWQEAKEYAGGGEINTQVFLYPVYYTMTHSVTCIQWGRRHWVLLQMAWHGQHRE